MNIIDLFFYDSEWTFSKFIWVKYSAGLFYHWSLCLKAACKSWEPWELLLCYYIWRVHHVLCYTWLATGRIYSSTALWWSLVPRLLLKASGNETRLDPVVGFSCVLYICAVLVSDERPGRGLISGTLGLANQTSRAPEVLGMMICRLLFICLTGMDL